MRLHGPPAGAGAVAGAPDPVATGRNLAQGDREVAVADEAEQLPDSAGAQPNEGVHMQVSFSTSVPWSQQAECTDPWDTSGGEFNQRSFAECLGSRARVERVVNLLGVDPTLHAEFIVQFATNRLRAQEPVELFQRNTLENAPIESRHHRRWHAPYENVTSMEQAAARLAHETVAPENRFLWYHVYSVRHTRGTHRQIDQWLDSHNAPEASAESRRRGPLPRVRPAQRPRQPHRHMPIRPATCRAHCRTVESQTHTATRG